LTDIYSPRGEGQYNTRPLSTIAISERTMMTENNRDWSQLLDSPSAMLSRLRDFTSLPIDSAEANASGECVSVLTRTDWLQILLLRYVEDPETLRIEVEVFMPTHPRPEDSARPRKMPLAMIGHMEYIIGLLDAGFSLQVLGDECLWVASKQFKGLPGSQIVQKLIPPSLE
jgi:hypothetical protein